MSKPELEPPDLKQCQAEKPNGYNFMTLGGRPGRVRCTSKPTVIATEVKPGADGLTGSMSLCDDCRAVMEKQMPGHATFSKIEPDFGERVADLIAHGLEDKEILKYLDPDTAGEMLVGLVRKLMTQKEETT
jgi:hypothetical protein